MNLEKMIISVAGRSSRLSQAQIQEVWKNLKIHHPHVHFVPHLVNTTGDNDQKTSLRSLRKTDFFTKEVDQLLLSEKCRIAIHSAKDLPENLPEGLKIIALTIGLDPSDSLVMLPGFSIHTLPSNALIATSSERREEAVKQLRSDVRFTDIRGTISQRLEKLNSGEAHGVVIAEAALIRLELTHLNRITLPGPTVPFQGQLAILARCNDAEMQQLFNCLDCREAQ
jgi:hydroxymethylbilane synthase